MKSAKFLSECSRAKCFFSQSSKPNELTFKHSVLRYCVCLKGPHGHLIRIVVSTCDGFEYCDVTSLTS